jgi:hypothetical protein
MRFSEYDRWFSEEVNRISLEPSCKQVGPFVTPTASPNKPPWQTEWTVLFGDDSYFRVVENWYRRKATLGGTGYREAFSFHYGPTNPDADADGVPLRSPQYPAIIRIDQDDLNGPHLHYNGEDHIPQARVSNLRITDAELFNFIRAVQANRTSGKRFDEILGFKVTK